MRAKIYPLATRLSRSICVLATKLNLKDRFGCSFWQVFYAQRMCDLESKNKYYPNTHFLKIKDIFTSIKSEDAHHYREQALKLMS